jgi:hypothetical protein
MLETYAAWTEGAKDSDIEMIEEAMNAASRPLARAVNSSQMIAIDHAPAVTVNEASTPRAELANPSDTPASPEIRHHFATEERRERVKCLKARRINWRRERDSNPRWAFDPYTLSRGAPSTTRPSLRRSINLSRRARIGRDVPLSW